MKLEVKRINHIFLLILILTLSGFTHLWNPVGFPDIFFDEGVYMRRAMHTLNGLGPQESNFHDHPFFGQIFLAGIFYLIGYPNSIGTSPDASSIAGLYLVPRILMGLMVILDTFLIYKISEKRYGTKVAIIASLLFAVMPITWITRRILLDNILLPFLLSSMLLAFYSKEGQNKKLLVFCSGLLLGIAIFTKIPALTMIPLIAGMVYSSTRDPKILGLWLLPVVLIPLVWPLQSIQANEFSIWLKDVIWQTQRHSEGLAYISQVFLDADPVLFILGISGFIFAAIRRDLFILVWLVPFLIFLFVIGYNQYFYWIPVLPLFCIATAKLLGAIFEKIKRKPIKSSIQTACIIAIAIFGLVSTTMLISLNLTTSQFEATSIALKSDTDQKNTTVLASPEYSWIFNYIFHKKNVLIDYSLLLFQPIETKKILLIDDPHFRIDLNRGRQLQDVLNSTNTLASFDGNVKNYDSRFYPYTNLNYNIDGYHIEVRTK